MRRNAPGRICRLGVGLCTHFTIMLAMLVFFRRTVVNDANAFGGFDCDTSDHVSAAWPHATNLDLLANSDRLADLHGEVRREVNFGAVFEFTP